MCGHARHVIGQFAQRLLATFDRVVLLHRFVALLFGGEDCAHFEKGNRTIRCEREDRLERIRVATILAVE